MDTDLRHARRTGDPVAELTALTRMPALRGLPPCRHCGRDLSRVEVACHTCTNSAPGVPGQVGGVWCWACGKDGLRGTGRTEWPWRGDGGRLALMAYAGDETARALVPFLALDRVPGIARSMQVSPLCVDQWPMDHFLGNLHRWPGALLGAGILAGRAVLPTWETTPEESGGGALLVPTGRRYEFSRDEPCTCRTATAWLLDDTGLCELCHGFGKVPAIDGRPHQALDAATEHHHCGCVESREAWHGLVVSGDLPEFCLVSSDVVFAPGVTLDGHPAWLARLLESWKQHDEPTIRAAICAGLTGWARAGVL